MLLHRPPYAAYGEACEYCKWNFEVEFGKQTVPMWVSELAKVLHKFSTCTSCEELSIKGDCTKHMKIGRRGARELHGSMCAYGQDPNNCQSLLNELKDNFTEQQCCDGGRGKEPVLSGCIYFPISSKAREQGLGADTATTTSWISTRHSQPQRVTLASTQRPRLLGHIHNLNKEGNNKAAK